MKYLVAIVCLAAGPALADPGHLAEVAGHGHWLGAAAAGAAIAVAVWAGLKARGKDATEAEAETDAGGDDELQET